MSKEKGRGKLIECIKRTKRKTAKHENEEVEGRKLVGQQEIVARA